jgi:hypothetical protein
VSARTYRGGVPAPPKEIAEAMAEAGKTGDQARLGLLKAQYEEWLEEQGYQRPTLGRPHRADEAAR